MGSVKGEPQQQPKKNVSIQIVGEQMPSVEMVSERRKGGRPASLILAKGDRPIFKISRSYSFDEDDGQSTVNPVSPMRDESPNRDESQPLVN